VSLVDSTTAGPYKYNPFTYILTIALYIFALYLVP
jgi:hypothetical protein